jgi:hypothetical protein
MERRRFLHLIARKRPACPGSRRLPRVRFGTDDYEEIYRVR